MRGIFILMLGCLVGCAATETATEETATEAFTPPEIDYATARGAYVAEPDDEKWLRADVTLLDLDGDAVARMFDLDDAGDIAPRSYRWPAGEIASAGAVLDESAELLARPSFWVDGDTTHAIEQVRSHFYLADYAGEEEKGFTPLIQEYREVTMGSIRVEPLGDGRFNVTGETEVQLAGRPDEFTTSLRTGTRVTIQVPELVRAQRVGVESLSPGETAMFQLARIKTGGRVAYRLLFVCLVDTRGS